MLVVIGYLTAWSWIDISFGIEEMSVRNDAGDITGYVKIPTTMMEAMTELDLAFSEEHKTEFLAAYRAEPISFHFGLGLYLRNEWGLWSGSKLARRLKWAGIRHPDDMSGYIMDEYADYLEGRGYSTLFVRRIVLLVTLSTLMIALASLVERFTAMIIYLLRATAVQLRRVG